MIKASKFSLSAGLFGNSSKLQPLDSHPKDQISFTKGDPTAYGNEEFQMTNAGYEIMRESIRNTKNHSYTASNGTIPARQAVAKHFGGAEQKLTEKDVILTHGANMGLFISLMSITNPGDNILVPDFCYPFFTQTAPSVGVEARRYQLDQSKNFEINIQHLEELVDQNTRFLWVVNPSNPSGSVFSKAHMEEIFEFCRKHKLFIISDEVYWNESFSSYEFNSFGHMTTDVPVMVIGGMEKTFFVPGWGLSWILFFDPFQKLNLIKQACLTSCQLFLHPCSFVMAALPQLLDTLGTDFSKNSMNIIEENCQYLYDKFAQIEGLKPIQPQGTFYLSVLIDLQKFKNFSSDSQFLQSLSDEENVQILNLSAFSESMQGFRMVTCSTIEVYDKLIPRIQQFCLRHYSE